MVRMVANESFNYGIPQRLLGVGEEFDALSDSDAKVLREVGKAKDAPKYKTQQIISDEVHEVKSDEAAGDASSSGNKRGRYRRSDMRPED